MFSCEFCEICKNTFFTEHIRMTASVPQNLSESMFFRKYMSKPNFYNTIEFLCFYKEKLFWWPDGAYINNDSINAVI